MQKKLQFLSSLKIKEPPVLSKQLVVYVVREKKQEKTETVREKERRVAIPMSSVGRKKESFSKCPRKLVELYFFSCKVYSKIIVEKTGRKRNHQPSRSRFSYATA